jgi:hypothetical protein
MSGHREDTARMKISIAGVTVLDRQSGPNHLTPGRSIADRGFRIEDRHFSIRNLQSEIEPSQVK